MVERKTAEVKAAGVRFELTSPCGLAVFKTAPFDRSATPPLELCTGHRRLTVVRGPRGAGPADARFRDGLPLALELVAAVGVAGLVGVAAGPVVRRSGLRARLGRRRLRARL